MINSDNTTETSSWNTRQSDGLALRKLLTILFHLSDDQTEETLDVRNTSANVSEDYDEELPF